MLAVGRPWPSDDDDDDDDVGSVVIILMFIIALSVEKIDDCDRQWQSRLWLEWPCFVADHLDKGGDETSLSVDCLKLFFHHHSRNPDQSDQSDPSCGDVSYHHYQHHHHHQHWHQHHHHHQEILSRCSASCGGGERMVEHVCKDSNTGTTVNEGLCDLQVVMVMMTRMMMMMTLTMMGNGWYCGDFHWWRRVWHWVTIFLHKFVKSADFSSQI